MAHITVLQKSLETQCRVVLATRSLPLDGYLLELMDFTA